MSAIIASLAAEPASDKETDMMLFDLVDSFGEENEVVWYKESASVSIALKNGWLVSLGFGQQHKCSNIYLSDDPREATSVEMMIVKPDGSTYIPEDTCLPEFEEMPENYSHVESFVPLDRAAEILNYISLQTDSHI